MLTREGLCDIIFKRSTKRGSFCRRNGGIAQLARATGSYPVGHGFKSNLRYHGPLVKRLRHGPFTAVTWVRFPYGSPKKITSELKSSDVIFLSKPQAWHGITRQRVWHRRRRMASPKVYFLRLDSIRDFVAIPYRNKLRIPYTPLA